MSRTTSLQDLYFVGKFIRPKPISENDNHEIEKRRWSKKRLLPKFKLLRSLTDSSTRIFYHNIQSFKKHKKLVQNDDTYSAANVLIFSETWSLQSGKMCLHNFEPVFSIPSGHSTRKPAEITLFLKKTMEKHLRDKGFKLFQAATGKLELVWMMLKNTLIAGVYAKPKTPIQLYNTLFKYLSRLHYGKQIIMGDFNLISEKYVYTTCKPMLQKYNYSLQNHKMPTTTKASSLDWDISNKSVRTGKYISLLSHNYPIWTQMACSPQHVLSKYNFHSQI